MGEIRNTPYRVLIVDDEPEERDLLAELLSGPKRSVEVCDSPRRALEFLEHNPVDLAFLDHCMPGMTGAELAKRIKEKYPHTHIVFCTGYLVETGCPEVRDQAEHILHKPLNLGEVLQLADTYSAQ
jgi:CheY-like chemotaxis protein